MFKRILYLLFLSASLMGSLVHAQSKAPAPASQTALAYKVTLTDLLRIDIYQEDDLRTISRVDSKGNINLPLVSEVHVAGLTVSEAQKAVENAYRDGRYLRSPQVTINVEAYAAREVSIQGQVRSPGRYPLPIETSMTVLELVTRAGGFTDTAKGTAVNVTRVSPEGKKQVFTIDVDSLLKGKDRANIGDNSLMLEPGDIVFVPERLI
ncbi:polysaccharide biosynthesis/export family protein [Rariglobus hedericola]|uniref:Polysaccharide export protein n=1 Tax=Rariglobus hedericola TaxID=2597822 RepID=A0A556QNZ2_9BACT|nr:polysaccharide biosynthesis/export family protein [Rariglobus hedericola]TSJ78370.1 polysaccharide export protein [Rariglobus hedericola]